LEKIFYCTPYSEKIITKVTKIDPYTIAVSVEKIAIQEAKLISVTMTALGLSINF